MQADWTFALGLVVTATLITLACLLLISALQIRSRRPATIFGVSPAETVFIFDEDRLLDATPPARALITPWSEEIGPWFRTLARLEPMFPGLGTRLEGLQREGRFVLCSREDLRPPLLLRAEYLGGLTRMTLSDGSETSAAASAGQEGLAELALRDELSLLRDTLSGAPLPVWHETPEGAVIWANGPYLALVAERLDPGLELSWPPPALFPATSPRGETSPRPAAEQSSTEDTPGGRARHPPGAPADRPVFLAHEGQKHWFQLVSRPMSRGGHPAGVIRYALPADELISAENSLRDFTQTLSKTFAQLPIGLAIFDHARRLQMFNPALTDLTGLAVDFLIARPTLPALLDTMRESSMLPEPKDYRSWRSQMADMEKAAAEGLFQDTWMLASGQTWRVTGRPHPNGALAFMIEDISTEMTRTRRFRADLELGQAVIDAMADAVVVFAQDGTLAMANAAAALLWGEEIRQQPLPGVERPRPVSSWRSLCTPGPLWNELEAYIGQIGPRTPWEAALRLKDGRAYGCRVAPMPHGATLVTFTPGPAEAAALPSGPRAVQTG